MNALSEENMVLEIILSQEYYSQEIQTIEVLISEIKIKTNISKIVKYLSQNISFEDLKHLKRIKSIDNCFEIIICINSEQNKQLLQQMNEYLTQNDLLPMKTTVVPKNMPKNHIQYELASKLWPVSYHPNKYIDKCLNSSIFDENERSFIFNTILKTIKVSEKPPMITVVADSSHQILTICESEVEINPLRHSALVAIDRISRIQLNDRQNNRPNDGYLCNGYDFYMSCEPCLMCAMALIHSRIKRLFFLQSNDVSKGCDCSDRAITLHKFHLLPKLNHHFECWKISFK